MRQSPSLFPPMGQVPLGTPASVDPKLPQEEPPLPKDDDHDEWEEEGGAPSADEEDVGSVGSLFTQP